ncbi:MAG: Crp/Fnr family transcriptional regulator [Acidobacteriota bacterium]|nr:Crp/Fnr family transcriptional regulator [Acidobacteriota bacterium]
MRKKRPAKAHVKTMLTTQNLRHEEGANESVEGHCDSPISEVRGLDNVKVRRYYPRGSVLFVEGQRPKGFYVLCEGRAKVSIASAEGKTLVLRIAQPGELLGVNAALTGQPYKATVEMLQRCRIDFVSRGDLLKLLDRDKKACLGVAQALSSTLNGFVEHARLLLLSQSAAEKLARLLVRWCDELGKRTPQGTRIDSGLTHEEIAQMICASRETVTRLLSDFKRKHIVNLIDNAIFVRNRKALESVARC